MTLDPLRARLGSHAQALGAWALAPASPRSARALMALCLALAALFGRANARHDGFLFPIDDAYITLHNAVALAAGHDPNFAGVSPLVGSTSLAHLLWVRLFLTAFAPTAALFAASWVAIAGYAWGLVALARAHKLSPLLMALTVVFGVTAARTPHHLVNGLETGLALALFTWVLALGVDDPEAPPSRARPLVWGALVGLMPFVRPELAVFSAGLVALRLWRRRRPLRREGLFVLAGLALGAAPILAWMHHATGAWVPATIAAKRVFFAEGCLPAALRHEWSTGASLLMAATLGYASRGLVLAAFSPLGRLTVVALGVFIGAYDRLFPGALGHYEQRYWYIFLPALVATLCELTQARRRAVALCAIGLLAVGADQSLTAAPARWSEHLANIAFTRDELRPAARFVAERLPRDARVLIHDAGFMSFAASRPMVDFVGLKTPWVPAYHARLTYPTCGRDRAEAVHQIALEGRVTHLVMLDSWEQVYRVVEGLRARGWVVEDLRREGRYRVYGLRAPTAR
ncbi:MAG: hypothetical protein JNK72_03455 [Myxococcales bacterium]|nr:hypothetical protein [Myxococcales bacterium]